MDTVAPTRTDPVAANGSQVIGGPLGRWAAVSGNPGRALQIVLGIGTITFILGAIRTIPCSAISWASPDRDEMLCYSDIPTLFILRGLFDGSLPYLDGSATTGGQPLEYPVLTGVFAWLGGLLVPGDDSRAYYWVTVVLLYGCLLAALAATAMYARHRVWDGLLLAMAPGVALASFINWDWFAVALTSLALLAWSRSRPVLAGAVLGLAIAAKFYPLLLFGPLALLCWRRRRVWAFVSAFAAAAAAWLAVNVPFMLASVEGWSYFFTFSQERGQDFGSIWLATSLLGWTVDPAALNLVATCFLVALCAGIGVLALTGARPPRLAQLSFLVVAAFLLTNKVYSPQFVLWLLPLAVLARPRWRDFLIWQACEAVYFVAIWWYIVGLRPDADGLPGETYALAILVHIAGTGYLAAMVVRDIVRPECDPVRTDPTYPGAVGGFDDPGGGVLDGAPDRRGRLVRSDTAA